jgi:hypothetical protein
LHHVLSTYGRHFGSLVFAKELLTYTHLLSHCPHLYFFGCYTLPSNDLLAVIPRTIKSLAVANLYFDPTAQPLLMALEHITQRLGTCPHLRLLDWYGFAENALHERGISQLQERCTSQGIELRTQVVNIVRRGLFIHFVCPNSIMITVQLHRPRR